MERQGKRGRDGPEIVNRKRSVNKLSDVTQSHSAYGLFNRD